MADKADIFTKVMGQLAAINAGLGDPVIHASDEDINQVFSTLEFLAHHDEYYVALDLKGIDGIPQVLWKSGIERCLGYDESSWSIKDSFAIIHEDYFLKYAQFALGAYRLAKTVSEIEDIRALRQRYVIHIPVRKKNGSYVWVKQMSMPLRFDQNGMIVQQLNSFTIICGFEDVILPTLPRFFDRQGNRVKLLNDMLLKITGETVFTYIDVIYLETIKEYFELKKDGTKKPSAELLSGRLHLSQQSVVYRFQQINKIVSKIFDEEKFDNIHKCMQYLESMYGIDTILAYHRKEA